MYIICIAENHVFVQLTTEQNLQLAVNRNVLFIGICITMMGPTKRQALNWQKNTVHKSMKTHYNTVIAFLSLNS
jgi:hypothetical protein